MKLIHLPTGEEWKFSINRNAEFSLTNYPDVFIRAELPEHWRVEGYDKSWEWMEKEPNASGTKWEWVSNQSVFTKEDSIDGFKSSNMEGMKLSKISRAEFEYHIYNPWKEKQEDKQEMAELDALEIQATENINLDTLKQQAEKMGYELVQKTIKWHMGGLAFTLYMDGDCMIEDKIEDESFRVSFKMAQEIIEKYNQFKNQ
jgi:hypothetical protein